MRPIVIVISGATPYLGGPETWRPLERAAPDIDFIVVDPLDFVEASSLDAALYERIHDHLPRVAAVVAHFNADRAVVELFARERPDVPIALVSPCTMFSNRSRLRIVSTILERPWVGRTIAALARAKLRRLRASRELVVRNLSSFVGATFLDDRIVDEACARVCDERTTRAVARTTDLLRELLRPIGLEARARANVRVIVGSSPLDRRTARRTRATSVPGVAAAMIEAPLVVAAILRESIGGVRP